MPAQIIQLIAFTQIMEKSWNLKKGPKSWKNHGISKRLYGKILEKYFGAPRIPSNTDTLFRLLYLL